MTKECKVLQAKYEIYICRVGSQSQTFPQGSSPSGEFANTTNATHAAFGSENQRYIFSEKNKNNSVENDSVEKENKRKNHSAVNHSEKYRGKRTNRNLLARINPTIPQITPSTGCRIFKLL